MKKIISLTVAAMLMVTLIPSVTFAASEIDTWDGTINTDWYTSANPEATNFTIETAEDLAGLAQIVNGDAPDIDADRFTNKTVTLTKDLDLAGIEWTPIGKSNAPEIPKPFLGTFDGGNHSISNMKIDRNSDASGTDESLGLFGYATAFPSRGATLKNISVLNVSVTGYTKLGGLVGNLHFGTIINCHTSGEVIGNTHLGGLAGDAFNSEIISSSSSANLNGSGPYSSSAGGLVGAIATGKISYSFATGNVVGVENVGGLAGDASQNAAIKNCYARGSVSGTNYVGGLIGWGRGGTTENSYATGVIVGTGDSQGGLIGTQGNSGIVINSYGNNANVALADGTNGSIYTDGLAGATIEQMKTAEFAAALGPVFAHDDSINDGFPYLHIPAPKEPDEPIPAPAPGVTLASVPETSDNLNIHALIAIAMISILGICIVAKKKLHS